MRLICADIKGYGRLVDPKINLGSKAIAVVGTNEAEKTTGEPWGEVGTDS